MRETDWAWVSACMGVVEGDICPVEAYLNSGGDPTRFVGRWRPFIYDFFPDLIQIRFVFREFVRGGGGFSTHPLGPKTTIDFTDPGGG